jgi:uncharacterized protein
VLIVDTGPLVALGDRDDQDHLRCRELLEGDPGPLVTTALVIAEAGYMLSRGLGVAAELALIAMIRDRSLKVEPLHQADWDRIHQLVEMYADLGLGVTDASLIAIAERNYVTRIATIDRRHFAVVRPAHCDAFELLPPTN